MKQSVERIDASGLEPTVAQTGVEAADASMHAGQEDSPCAHREHRQRRITLAWSSSLLSKIATSASTIFAIPLVYRALGQSGYAAYAAVTSSAGLIAALNLGIGGSLVSPIAHAAAKSDEREQAILVQAGLAPLVLFCIVGAAIAIPIVSFVPLKTLFGNAGANATSDLRIASILAVTATLAAIPISSITFLRQAYQEMHLSSLIGAGANTLLCIGLIAAAKMTSAVSVFVAIFVLIPLTGQSLNLLWLFSKRRFLLQSYGFSIWKNSKRLLADGLRFVGADFAGLFVYQWPVYWIARTSSSSTSSWFALCMQATILQLSFVGGFLQPLWASTADALARGDHKWLASSMHKGRRAILLMGCALFLVILIFGEQLLHLWLQKQLGLSLTVRAFIGSYCVLATWEYYHFMLTLGFGRLREAAGDIFARSVVFAIFVPLLTRIGGVPLVWCGMCCSILLWTAWRLPRLLRLPVDQSAAA